MGVYLLPERAASLAAKDALLGPLTPDEIATGYGRSIVERMMAQHEREVRAEWQHYGDMLAEAVERVELVPFHASER